MKRENGQKCNNSVIKMKKDKNEKQNKYGEMDRKPQELDTHGNYFSLSTTFSIHEPNFEMELSP